MDFLEKTYVENGITYYIDVESSAKSALLYICSIAAMYRASCGASLGLRFRQSGRESEISISDKGSPCGTCAYPIYN